MSTISLHQFSPAAYSGDGVTNGMFYMQRILQDFGFHSNIYAESIDEILNNKVFNYKELFECDDEVVLFIHYSIYYDFDKWINQLKLKKIMIYHNITPPEFFAEDTFLHQMCKQGIAYLPKLANKVDGAIGDSPLNSSELLKNNFNNVKTIPLLMDIDKIIKTPFSNELFDEKSKEFSIIFVGRIARNKAQHDIIEIANIYYDMCEDFHLYIIGGTTDPEYEALLKKKVRDYRLDDNVTFTGKVSNEELYAYYRSANIFLCMSEHEGFGMPLIESMLFDVPVLAYNSSNIKSTLNGGGVLFHKKEYKKIAAVIALIRKSPAFKREILQIQREARKSYYHETIVKDLKEYLKNFNIRVNSIVEQVYKKSSVRFLFEGPFDSSYSLALLNRYAAESFEKKYTNQVALFSTDGLGDYPANKDFLQQYPLIAKMEAKSQKAMQCEVVLRNLYPPRVADMKGELNILNAYGWEESSFPKEYVEAFNEKLDGITVMSSYVKELLIANGVTAPISVVGLGVDHILQKRVKSFPLRTKKLFKFLHISSAFPRKGVDLLLQAYSDLFTSADDVTLIIKTFPNPHNTIEEDIKKLQLSKSDLAEIIVINEDLEDAEIAWLYKECDVLVAPSRGEGFGLPMAEAMLFDLPVITTAFGGQSDFATHDTAWLIDYKYAKAKTHFNLFNSYWVEPSLESLQELLYQFPKMTEIEKKEKTTKAKALIQSSFSWENYREKTEEFIAVLKQEEPLVVKKLKVAWISTYNSKCGIASYSEFLINELQYEPLEIKIFANKNDAVIDLSKESKIDRTWNDLKSKNSFYKDLLHKIDKEECNHIVINFNFSFFSMEDLEEIILYALKNNIGMTIIFHSVADVDTEGLKASLSSIAESLQKVTTLLVHNIDDLNHLKILGCKNIQLLPHGIKSHYKTQIQNHKDDMKVIASYGFLLPHKGILELIEAFSIIKNQIPNVKLRLVNALYPAEVSQSYYEECLERIDILELSESVEFYTEYLSDADSFELLEDVSVIVLPYRETNESSSAAVRYALATYKPVVCTQLKIFDDVEDVVHFMPDFSSEAMASTMIELLKDERALHEKERLQKRWIEEHDWSYVAQKLKNHLLK